MICRGKSVSHVVGLKPVNIIDKIYIYLVAETFSVEDSLAVSLMDPPQALQKSIDMWLVLCVCELPLRRFVASSTVQHDRAKDACTCDEL